MKPIKHKAGRGFTNRYLNSKISSYCFLSGWKNEDGNYKMWIQFKIYYLLFKYTDNKNYTHLKTLSYYNSTELKRIEFNIHEFGELKQLENELKIGKKYIDDRNGDSYGNMI